MTILHTYILRELLKTFALSLAALTVLFTLGGGVYVLAGPMQEQIAGAELGTLVPLLVPIFVTIVMPLAAIFSATMVYGRFAADNELLACAAAGINVHRLFLSARLLSIFVVVFTLYAGNYLIPDLIRVVTGRVQSGLRDIAFSMLKTRGFVQYNREFFFTAEGVDDVRREDLAARNFPVEEGIQYILVTAPTALHVRQGRLERFITGDYALCRFDSRSGQTRVTATVYNARNFQVGRNDVRFGEQSIEFPEIGALFADKADWHKLSTLLVWRREPWHWQDRRLAPRFRSFMGQLAVRSFYADSVERFQRDGRLELTTEAGERLVLSASGCTFGEREKPVFDNVKLALHRADGQLVTRYEAARAELIARAPTSADPRNPLAQIAASARRETLLIEISLLDTPEPVREYTRSPDGEEKMRLQPRTSRDGIVLPPHVEARLAEYTPQRVFDPNIDLRLESELDQQRGALIALAGQQSRKVTGLIHFRLAYAASALAVTLAAVLGVVFRGSRGLTAFALSCVPIACLGILMLMGRQLIEHERTHAIGPYVMWGAIAAVLVVDQVIRRLGVQR